MSHASINSHKGDPHRLLTVALFLPSATTTSIPKKQFAAPLSLPRRHTSLISYMSNTKLMEAAPTTSQGNPGLYNAVKSTTVDNVWIGTVGYSTDSMTDEAKEILSKEFMQKHASVPVYITDAELEGHYDQFCKQVLTTNEGALETVPLPA
jgi:trehalose-6-phosphate synthase